MSAALAASSCPIAFGALNDLTGVWQSCFWLLFLIVSVSLVWMHLAIRQMERTAAGGGRRGADAAANCRKCSRSTGRRSRARSRLRARSRTGGPRTRRSGTARGPRDRPAQSVDIRALPAAVVRGLDGVVRRGREAAIRRLRVLQRTAVLARRACPALSGATLRVFYSFMPAIFGGRLWTTLTTWSLLIPAVGMGFAVQNPDTPYWIFLALALLCGLGGGNFASSMANISFFFPKAEKGNALAINAGLGNLGVSVVQFVVPLAITAGVFGWLGGAPQTATHGGVTTTLWLQNAGFVFVPFIAASAFAAWFGMNDIATMKASFADQAVIFRRTHNWIMCWLYTGTFGSFIGFSAAFPLLSKILFPGRERAAICFPRPARRRPRAGARRQAERPDRRRADHALGVHRHEPRRGRRPLRHRHERRSHRLPGVLRELPVPFRSERRRQRVHLPDDPGDHAQGSGAAGARTSPAPILSSNPTRNRPRSSASRSAVAAYGAFFIPKSFGTSIAATGGAEVALYASWPST